MQSKVLARLNHNNDVIVTFHCRGVSLSYDAPLIVGTVRKASAAVCLYPLFSKHYTVSEWGGNPNIAWKILSFILLTGT